MEFARPLIRGRLVQRYKRFLADVVLEEGARAGETVTAHCANSGSMRTVNTPGSPVWLSPAQAPGRRLAWTWEIIQVDEAFVGVNTSTPNRVVAEAIHDGRVPALAGYARIRREVPYAGRSRIDLLLEADDRPSCYVEVKNVTMKEGGAPQGVVLFPDAVTARGAKHLEDLATMVAQGARAVMVYLVQRTDGDAVGIAQSLDPAYGAGLAVALDRGVEVVCLGCAVDPATGIWVNRTLPLVWPPVSPQT
ncbi:DNA/RNA nuclease SfsA [Pararhodospirillum oryzae]|uniref:Sugar fermentation stimulation protein homolog n=1 Tax=Pararhodospirillum oryzae TaxID=478448 RepID=A0A512H4X3_9PROT|nr:DNA/RNA nuclease SfsA [Pararhodospirillum oryzae]GEO80516.1 sugar fermentation stimulation protein [Pararhodospirillum oryzae]